MKLLRILIFISIVLVLIVSSVKAESRFGHRELNDINVLIKELCFVQFGHEERKILNEQQLSEYLRLKIKQNLPDFKMISLQEAKEIRAGISKRFNADCIGFFNISICVGKIGNNPVPWYLRSSFNSYSDFDITFINEFINNAYEKELLDDIREIISSSVESLAITIYDLK